MINDILQKEFTILEKNILKYLKKPCESKIIGQWHCILDDYPPFNTYVDVCNISQERFKNAILDKTNINGGTLVWRFSEYDSPNNSDSLMFNSYYSPIVYWCFLPEIPSIYERLKVY